MSVKLFLIAVCSFVSTHVIYSSGYILLVCSLTANSTVGNPSVRRSLILSHVLSLSCLLKHTTTVMKTSNITADWFVIGEVEPNLVYLLVVPLASLSEQISHC